MIYWFQNLDTFSSLIVGISIIGLVFLTLVVFLSTSKKFKNTDRLLMMINAKQSDKKND